MKKIFAIAICVVAFALCAIEPYQRAFIALRLKNFVAVPGIGNPSDIYSIPDQWLDEIDAPYVPERPSYPSQKDARETLRDPNFSYRASIMKSGLGQESRDLYADLSNNSEEMRKCQSTPRNCVGFLPAHRFSSARLQGNRLFDRYGIEIPIIILKGKSEKILIALHGKGGSPEGVACKIKDYSNCFGEYWNKKGYTVYAPAVEAREDWSVPRLNLDSVSSDLSKIEDIIFHIKSTKGPTSQIYIAGISYGAVLAEYSALLFPEILGLISIGGEGRYIYGESEFSLPSMRVINTNRNILRNGRIFEIIESHKPILVSVGLNDAGSFNDDGYTKFRMYKKFKYSKNVRFHFFNGAHESDPENEYRIFIDMMSNK